jgi:hypothetical protein
MPYALCPMPARAPHVTEKGYKTDKVSDRNEAVVPVAPQKRAASCSRPVQKTTAAARRDESEFFCHGQQGGKQAIDTYVLLSNSPSF